MKMFAWISGCALALGPMAWASPPMPPGMARADNPQQVAALYSEKNQQRVAAVQKTAEEQRLTPQDEYTLKLIAYRTQLVEEQRQRKIKELELEREREIRLQAELEALKAERERERDVVVLHHQAFYAYHQWLQNRHCWQASLRGSSHGQHHTCPVNAPLPAAPEPPPPVRKTKNMSKTTVSMLP